MPVPVAVGILAVLVILGLASAVWVMAPALQGPDAARRDLGSHRLEFGGWLTALVLIALVSLPVGRLFNVSQELTLSTFIVSALATDVPLLLFVYVRLILPGAMTWTEL